MTQPNPLTIDGRTLRRTGRTEQLATKVRPEIKAMVIELAQSCDMAINEIIETSVEAIYREKMQGASRPETDVTKDPV